jgi:hypothetical protein
MRFNILLAVALGACAPAEIGEFAGGGGTGTGGGAAASGGGAAASGGGAAANGGGAAASGGGVAASGGGTAANGGGVGASGGGAVASGGGATGGGTAAGGGAATGGGGQSWTTGPIVEADAFTTLYALSDLHGHYPQLATLLFQNGLIASVPTQPGGVTWTGGDATLVVVGDMIDKGTESLEVVEALMALQTSAQAHGGKVVALLGNHEAEFFADPTGSKFTGSDGIDTELASQTPSIAPAAFADGNDPRGAWIRALPFGARVGSWFFCHAGDTGGLSVSQLDALLTAALASSTGWGSDAIVGTTSLLESRSWYTPSIVSTNAAALGVKHIGMGHDPNAFSATGDLVTPSGYQGSLFKLDTGLGSNASNGALLRVRHAGSVDVAEKLLPDGSVSMLWSGAP